MMKKSPAITQAAHKLISHSDFLNGCRVDTPLDVVENIWKLLGSYRQTVGSVLDVGAGDGRFALFGNYGRYVGYEIDIERTIRELPDTATIRRECVFHETHDEYDLCIGNPPYVRHHAIEPSWRAVVTHDIERVANTRIDRKANAYVYFMWKALLSTANDGLVALVVPFEWVSRPSSRSLREYINACGWKVDVYRFTELIFDRVLTTAAVTVIDKSVRDGGWSYFHIDRSFQTRSVPEPTGTSKKVLNYRTERSASFAMRGLSPGSRRAFVLTEGERVHFGLRKNVDVVPAVTTLRHVTEDVTVLDASMFRQLFVDQGLRCWLIKPDAPSDELKYYLDQLDESLYDTATCRKRESWWAFSMSPIPEVLYASGFIAHGPKFLKNRVRARAIGSVCGVYVRKGRDVDNLLSALRAVDFESQLVRHAKTLIKVEVGQMNEVLHGLESQHHG